MSFGFSPVGVLDGKILVSFQEHFGRGQYNHPMDVYRDESGSLVGPMFPLPLERDDDGIIAGILNSWVHLVVDPATLRAASHGSPDAKASVEAAVEDLFVANRVLEVDFDLFVDMSYNALLLLRDRCLLHGSQGDTLL